ncbi:hypothetical protein P691DRAFT_778451 [Macrolepiota fuliginosa MF-IS2]|uniref:Uncharacterized protein n=1 Tax=Macrolepiota fuliginosa MF-IS2 TaxID=1400762 RepID=A0A9P5X5S7_9AGAR|nr:hypothetical protein P691DRAFT_778451 [Macrolepiota fuliginosa MF-IS2]
MPFFMGAYAPDDAEVDDPRKDATKDASKLDKAATSSRKPKYSFIEPDDSQHKQLSYQWCQVAGDEPTVPPPRTPSASRSPIPRARAPLSTSADYLNQLPSGGSQTIAQPKAKSPLPTKRAISAQSPSGASVSLSSPPSALVRPTSPSHDASCARSSSKSVTSQGASKSPSSLSRSSQGEKKTDQISKPPESSPPESPTSPDGTSGMRMSSKFPFVKMGRRNEDKKPISNEEEMVSSGKSTS